MSNKGATSVGNVRLSPGRRPDIEMGIREEPRRSGATSFDNNRDHRITVDNDSVPSSGSSETDAEKLVRLRYTGNVQLIVATLVATVTFTAGFTLPGGYNENEGPNMGLATLRKKKAFQAFKIADTLAFAFSLSAVILYFSAAAQISFERLEFLITRAALFVKLSIHVMLVAFLAGTYATLAPSSLAIATCVVGSVLSYFIILLILIASATYGIESSLSRTETAGTLQGARLWQQYKRSLSAIIKGLLGNL